MHEKASVHDSFTIARSSPETCVYIDIYIKKKYFYTYEWFFKIIIAIMILDIYIYYSYIYICIYLYEYIYISYTCTYRQSHIYHYIHDYDMHGFICYSKARGLKRRGVTSAVLSSNAFLLRACHCQSVFFVHCVYIIYVRVYVHAQYSLTCVCVCACTF